MTKAVEPYTDEELAKLKSANWTALRFKADRPTFPHVQAEARYLATIEADREKLERALALGEQLDAIARDKANLYEASQSALKDALGRIAELEKELAQARGLLWYGWNEMNTIHAATGVPCGFDGATTSVSPSYWASVVDAMSECLGGDCTPWPSDDAKSALPTPPVKGE